MNDNYNNGYAAAFEQAAPLLEKLQEYADKRIDLAHQNGYLKGLIIGMFTSLEEHGINPADVFDKELTSAIFEALKQR